MASKLLFFLAIVLFARATKTDAQTDCSTITALVFTCSIYIADETLVPVQGTPCCDAMTTLYLLSREPPVNRRIICSCFMDLIHAHNSSVSMIAALPGICGFSLGFMISAYTDCNIV
ncbi:hypothetical protein MLD38_015661 [Melastoma candidum]|uniref:Uncharacterized protein n=1 Tax=Melastoma candidum TaxID=119954 RepID=A0ACB9RG43_9MYRT|nr:hypothetical protein MLD38_015661 [Melastoma candidum]